MGSKGGGGGVDMSGMIEATDRATDLQEDIYYQTRADAQPWYNMGTGAVGRLSDLLGIQGGSVRSRDQIAQDLTPQYTSMQTAGSPDLFTTYDGRVVSGDYKPEGHPGGAMGNQPGVHRAMMQLTPLSQEQEVVDAAGLNAAIDSQYGAQETPDDYGSLLQRFGMEQFEEDPGYQFRKDEANTALERQMAAQGVTLGGGGYGEVNPQAYRAMQELNQGLASQEYGQAYNRYVNDQLNTFNMLMGASGSGQNVTNQMAASGQNYATNVGNLQTGLASAQMNAQMAEASQPSMFSQLLSGGTQVLGGYLAGGGTFSDKRVKENIEYKRTENGHKIYNFNYIGDDVTYEGVMAQDVLEYMPKAVSEIGGVLAVDYSRLGLDMKVVD